MSSRLDKSNIRVSVVVPVFNHESFIDEAILSVLNQNHPIYELIAIDDGSSDRSLNRLKAWSGVDGRVKVFTQQNRGASATINRGLHIAKGEWIAILNSDDSWSPNRISTLLKVALSTSSNVLFSECLPIDSLGKELEKSHYWQKMYAKLLRQVYDLGLRNALFRGNPVISTSNFLMHRNALERVGLLRHRRFVADWDWSLRAVLQAGVKHHWWAEPLFNYRLHENNTIHQSGLRSSLEIAHMFSRMQLCHPETVALLEHSRRSFVRDIRKHSERSAYARGQSDADYRNLTERQQAKSYIFLLESTLNQERDLAERVLGELKLERDEARDAKHQSDRERDVALANLAKSLNAASLDRERELSKLRSGYEQQILKLETILVQERELSARVRHELEKERDEARDSRREIYEAREADIKDLSRALEDAESQRKLELASVREGYESQFKLMESEIAIERKDSERVRQALQVERDEARSLNIKLNLQLQSLAAELRLARESVEYERSRRIFSRLKHLVRRLKI